MEIKNHLVVIIEKAIIENLYLIILHYRKPMIYYIITIFCILLY